MKSISAFLLITGILFSQHRLAGLVKSQTGQAISNALISVENHLYNSKSDNEGKFELDLPIGIYKIIIRRLGYSEHVQEIDLSKNQRLIVILQEDLYLDDEITVSANRAKIGSPIAYKLITKSTISSTNSGADLPQLLDLTPSTVSTSDAGSGFGYTGLRIRGSDMTRINVMLNGVPLNDSESQGVFWVDLPDIASSIESIQIQRGVGSSGNGAGSFGGSINIQTESNTSDPAIEFNNSFGSFNSLKHTLKINTGLFSDHFSIDLRLSQISSDGYIDRATSNLNSLYINAAYLNKSSSLNFLAITGKEKTYQAWNGVPVESLKSNRTFNQYNYENETDNYRQDHFQLVFIKELAKDLVFNSTFNYTHGEGYYEQFIVDDTISTYNLNPTQISNLGRADFIRQRWLDNDFYVFLSNIQYSNEIYRLTGGFFYSRYFGNHFGDVIAYKNNGIRTYINHQYYNNDANKTDFNFFVKMDFKVLKDLTFFADFQYRFVKYQFELSQNRGLETDDIGFFNPKMGLTYQLGLYQSVYASYSVANKEPGRDDYVGSSVLSRPESERLYDTEIGYRLKGQSFLISTNMYYMRYKNQLALTGELNDVGEYSRINLNKSYRLGLETELSYQLSNQFQIAGNVTISENKIVKFTEYVDNWSDGSQIEVNYTNTDLAFSPNLILASEVQYSAFDDFKISWTHKFVGQQFLDNTQSNSRSLGSYSIENLKFMYSFSWAFLKNIDLNLQINNLLNEEYESNGWVYRYFDGQSFQKFQNHFPQAFRHFMFSINLRL